MGTVLDVIFFKTLPFFFSWWKGEEETDSYRAGLWNVGRKPLAALHFPEANILRGRQSQWGTPVLKTPTAAPKPRWAAAEAQPGPPRPSSPAPVPCACGPRQSRSESSTPASRLGSGPALEVALRRKRLGAAEGRDSGSWAAGASPPRWESQPRPILLPARPGGPL